MLLATYATNAAGFGTFHRMTPEIRELRRMYVRPQFRRLRIGRQLAGALIVAAQEAGYGLMRFETTTFMDKAIAMYTSLGFRICPAYYVIPESFRSYTLFMELDLRLVN